MPSITSLPREENRVPAVGGVNANDSTDRGVYPFEIDPDTGRLLVNASISSGGASTDPDSPNYIQHSPGAITAKTGVVTASDDTTILTVEDGTYVKIFHWSIVPTTSSSNDRDVILKIGSTEIQGWRTNTNGGGFAHSPKNGLSWFEGADGEDVVLNLSGADSVRYNLTYEVV